MIKRIRVKGLEIGDIIADDVMYQLRKHPLVVKNTIVNEYIKLRLEELEIPFVKIYDPDYAEKHIKLEEYINEKEKIKKKQIFKASYSQNVSNVKDVFTDILKGENVNIHKVSNISSEIFNNTQDVYTILDSITEIKEIDEYTYKHSINVSLYSMLLGKWLGFGEKNIKELIQTGVLHDIGKGKVDQDILNKPSKLTDKEFDEIKRHTVYGYEICKSIIWLNDSMKNGVLMHHEKIDGSGYPLGLREKQIPIYAKIIAVCDVYDALNSRRVYKKEQTPFDTIKQMQESGIGSMDYVVLNTFLKNIVSIYIGSNVRLNTGEIGEIVFIPPEKLDRPILKINDKYIDISRSEKYKIEKII